MKNHSTNRRNLGLASAVVLSFIVASCGGESETASTLPVEEIVATTVPETTTTTIPVVVNPLTGAPAADESILNRPALVVKIDNHPRARPQWGLNQADLVFEENVEQLTRFAAVFHSQGSDPVGPIRSGRQQDIDLLGSLNHPLFAWSG